MSNPLPAIPHGTIVRVVLPLVFLGLAVFAQSAEAILLAPVMDMFKIADPTWQMLLAFAFGIIAAVLIHLTLEAERGSFLRRAFCATSVVMLAGLAMLGVLRAREVAFAAQVSGNPLGEFLANNPVLTAVVIAAFSVLFPVVAAFALHSAWQHLREWSQYRKARRQAQQLKQALDATRKEIEAEANKRDHQLAAVDRQCEEWRANYLSHWEFGRERGAKKGPLWMVWIKTLAVGLVSFAVLFIVLNWLGVKALWLLSVAPAAAIMLAAGARFYRKWDHPEPEELLRRANIEFRNERSEMPGPAPATRDNGSQSTPRALVPSEIRGTMQAN